jgi:hypothetical protein
MLESVLAGKPGFSGPIGTGNDQGRIRERAGNRNSLLAKNPGIRCSVRCRELAAQEDHYDLGETSRVEAPAMTPLCRPDRRHSKSRSNWQRSCSAELTPDGTRPGLAMHE